MMNLELSDGEAEVLREILHAQLPQLMIESARADSTDYRQMLQRRRATVAHVLEQLDQPR